MRAPCADPNLADPCSGVGVRKVSVLISGASGFLGRHILGALAANEPHVHPLALVRSRADWLAQDWVPLEAAAVDTIEGGVTGDDGWMDDARLSGLQGIYHLAALVRHSRRDPKDLYDTNVDGTLRMVRLAAKYRCRMVFVSTSGTVGVFRSPQGQADEDAPYCDPEVRRWPYYDSKVQAERKARALASELGVELIIIRPPILLGPGDHRFRSTGHIVRWLAGRLPFLIDGGMHFVDIRDAAAAMVAAMAHPAARPIYHLPGTACSIDAFFQMCQEVSGVAAPTRHLPFRVAWSLAQASERAADLLGHDKPVLPDPVVLEMARRWWGLKSRHAAQELGFSPRAPRQTLLDTIDWLRENHPGLRRKRPA